MKKFLLLCLCFYFISCNKELNQVDYLEKLNTILNNNSSNEKIIDFIKELPQDDLELKKKMVDDFANHKLKLMINKESEVLIKNQLESRDVPCYKSYMDSMTKATAQAYIDIFGLNLYWLEDYMERQSQAESDFYQYLHEKYGTA